MYTVTLVFRIRQSRINFVRNPKYKFFRLKQNCMILHHAPWNVIHLNIKHIIYNNLRENANQYEYFFLSFMEQKPYTY